MKTYTCHIYNQHGYIHATHTVTSTSALKCAKVLGLQQEGEVVAVFKDCKMLSSVRWDSHTRRYDRICVLTRLTDLIPGTTRMIIVTEEVEVIGRAWQLADGEVNSWKRMRTTWEIVAECYAPQVAQAMKNRGEHIDPKEGVTYYTMFISHAYHQIFIPDSWKEVTK